MTLPRVAIVGRPNVGKSSLLNRLARRKVSIVDPTPGVTRDRVAITLELDPPVRTPRGTPSHQIELTDTGGYGVYVAEGKRYNDVGIDLTALTPEIEAQIGRALDQAQLILFVIDAQAGLTSLDEAIAKLLRERGCRDRVLTVANKVDSDAWVANGLEAAGLGFGDTLCCSAKSGWGMRDLLDTLWEQVDEVVANAPPAPDDAEAFDGGEAEMKIAIIGKRNAGKSTLINAFAGGPRVIVSEIPGTTRDAVDVRFELEGRRMLAIDTAGVRRRKSFEDSIEHYAYDRMLRAIDRADVVLFLVDATVEISQVDKKLSQELQRRYKPTVIVINKWDKIDERKTSPEDYLDYLTRELRGLDYAPLVFISAEEQEGLPDVISMAFNLHAQGGHRVPTGELNRVIEEILQRRGPSSRLGTQAKLLYASQIAVHPPTIALVVNHPELFRGGYERYLMNRLREALPFSEVPIKLVFRKRQRMELQELKERPRKERGG